MPKRIIKIARQKTCSLSGCIQSKKGSFIIEKDIKNMEQIHQKPLQNCETNKQKHGKTCNIKI